MIDKVLYKSGCSEDQAGLVARENINAGELSPESELKKMSETDVKSVIKQKLADVQAEIAAACQSVGRNSADVKLVAVTKYADWNWVESLATLHGTFGENRPQQLAERCVRLPDINWHLIGQLQRNKAKQAIQTATLIHSVDSEKLLQRIAQIAAELNVRPAVLLQVNVSGEDSKSGFTAKELLAAWSRLQELHAAVDVCGLMTMAPASDDPEDARPTFAGLKELQVQLADRAAESPWQLKALSMGMSGDFSVAIQEGATLVRIGSRLFEGL